MNVKITKSSESACKSTIRDPYLKFDRPEGRIGLRHMFTCSMRYKNLLISTNSGFDGRIAIHSCNFGVMLQRRCQELGVLCELVYPDALDVKHATPTDYLIATLKAPAPEASNQK